MSHPEQKFWEHLRASSDYGIWSLNDRGQLRFSAFTEPGVGCPITVAAWMETGRNRLHGPYFLRYGARILGMTIERSRSIAAAADNVCCYGSRALLRGLLLEAAGVSNVSEREDVMPELEAFIAEVASIKAMGEGSTDQAPQLCGGPIGP